MPAGGAYCGLALAEIATHQRARILVEEIVGRLGDQELIPATTERPRQSPRKADAYPMPTLRPSRNRVYDPWPQAKGIYENLGVSVFSEELVEGEQVRVVMIPLGGSRLELLEPTAENSVIVQVPGQARRGPAPYLLRVPDLGAAVEKLKTRRHAPDFGTN